MIFFFLFRQFAENSQRVLMDSFYVRSEEDSGLIQKIICQEPWMAAQILQKTEDDIDRTAMGRR